MCVFVDEMDLELFLFPQEEVMVLERILLQTIKFDLQVEHPYMFLLRYVKQLKGESWWPEQKKQNEPYQLWHMDQIKSSVSTCFVYRGEE